MNWNDLKNAVATVIKTNGANEITGANHQSTLHDVIDELGMIEFRGTATPLTSPDIGDRVGMYLAKEDGTYSGFDSLEISNEVAFLVWDGSAWTKHTIVEVSSSFSLTTTQYNSDADAATGGVPLNGFYVAGQVHERSPWGSIVQRLF